tara:strand:+ start:6408 stop:6773 length:366 start_codon:yes stop_codon:yes gene_type:complete
MMKRPILYVIGFLVLSAVSLDGCYYDNRDDLYPNPVDTLDALITFADDIQPFITGSCANGASCHNADATNPVLETYDQIVSNIEGIERRAINEKTMPQSGPANQDQLDKLSKWIEDGKLNN